MEYFSMTTKIPSCVIIFATVLTLLPNVGALILALIVRKKATNWIKILKLPKWRPSKMVESILWPFVYSTTGFASFLVYMEGHGIRGAAQIPLILYTIQLLLNWGFLPLFFACHKLKCSFYEISLLVIMATFCAISFYQVSQVAGLLFIPYILWHVYMTSVTYVVYRNNYQEDSKRLLNEDFLRPELIINKTEK